MSRDLKIVLLGPTGSGKSTLFHTFVKGIFEVARKNHFVLTWRNHPLVNLPPDELPPPNVKLDDPIVGTMSGFHQQFQLLVTDPPGRDLLVPNEEILRRTTDCDLIVLVVDPHTLLDEVAEQSVRQAMVQFVQRLQNARSRAGGHPPVVALAFTKADEYALNGSPSLRCIDTDLQRKRFRQWVGAYRDRDGDVNAAWQALIAALCPPTDPFRIMRGHVLERSRHLFEEIVCGALRDDKYFNAYFVTSKPGDPHVRPFPWERRGVNEIFEDFFRVVYEDQTEPVISTRLSMFSLASCLVFLMGATSACCFAYNEGTAAASPSIRAAGWLVGALAIGTTLIMCLAALFSRMRTSPPPRPAAVAPPVAPAVPQSGQAVHAAAKPGTAAVPVSTIKASSAGKATSTTKNTNGL